MSKRKRIMRTVWKKPNASDRRRHERLKEIKRELEEGKSKDEVVMDNIRRDVKLQKFMNHV